MRYTRRMLTKRSGIILLTAVIVVICAYYVTHRPHSVPVVKPVTTHTTNKHIQPPAPKPAVFNMQKYSLSAADSLWVITNKHRPLNPVDYIPADLVVPKIPLRSNITSDEKYVRADNAAALEKMVASAATQGIQLNLQSGYRSYAFQVNLYNLYVKQQGQAQADSQSARPGYSEHQTGLAADLGGTSQPSCNVEECFGNTPEGKWLAANAYTYGYVIRYPEGKTNITGYTYEPWHVRYVGIALATEMHNKNIATLEEFFDLPAAPDYK